MNQTEKEFKEKLDALLREYSVDISVEEEHEGDASYIKGINCWSYTKYDDDGNVIRESINIYI
jgi:hypothetical protein